MPASGVVVTFTAARVRCRRPAASPATDGTCTTTLTLPASPAQGDTVTVTGTLSNAASGTATITTNDTFVADATNITVAAATPTAAVGTSDVITASVANQFGNASGANTQVFFKVTGGKFANGTTSDTETTDPTGQAQAAVTSATAGDATVTATIQPGSSTPNCSSDADPTTGAAAGSCSASTTVSFTGSTPPAKKIKEKPTLKVTSTRAGHLTLIAKTHPKVAHKRVNFYQVTASGKHKLLGGAKTTSSGVATETFKLTKGKTYTVVAKASLGSKYKSKYSSSKTKKVKS